MPGQINHRLLLQEQWDSGALTVLAAVYHQFKKKGTYRCTVLRSSEQPPTEAGECLIEVGDFAFSEQVEIDLSDLVRSDPGRRVKYKLADEGCASFFVARGSGGFALLIENEDGDLELDSRFLKSGDMFSVNILKPGLYEICAQDGEEKAVGSCALVSVVDPDDGKVTSINPIPHNLACSAKGVVGGDVTVHPGDIILISIQMDGVRIHAVSRPSE